MAYLLHRSYPEVKVIWVEKLYYLSKGGCYEEVLGDIIGFGFYFLR